MQIRQWVNEIEGFGAVPKATGSSATVMVVAGISEGHVRFAECGLSVHKEPALTGSPAGASDWWMC